MSTIESYRKKASTYFLISIFGLAVSLSHRRLDPYTLNNIGYLEGTLQYYHHATPGEPLQGDRTEGFFLKNLYCLEGTTMFV